MPKKHIPMAIAYDFDGTLSPINMQEHIFIPALGLNTTVFWKSVKKLAKEQDADEVLCYMHEMIRQGCYHSAKLTRSAIREYGKKIPLFEGVLDWFPRITQYGASNGVALKHYVISSGLKPMIEGTEIAKFFEKIFGCEFIYDVDERAIAPGVAVNYTTKTQYLFRINKGCLDRWDDKSINSFVPMEDRPMPFNNMIFIGDGDTDIPAMKMTNYQGGMSVAVYPPYKSTAKAKKLHPGRSFCNLDSMSSYS